MALALSLRCRALFAPELGALSRRAFDLGAVLHLAFGAALPAFRASAAALADEGREVILAVIDGDFLVRFDLPAGAIDDDGAAALDGLGVRPARMVDVARHV